MVTGATAVTCTPSFTTLLSSDWGTTAVTVREVTVPGVTLKGTALPPGSVTVPVVAVAPPTNRS